MTAHQRRVKAAAVAWMKKRGKRVTAVHHIYPRAYVIGRAAPGCLVAASPWMDAEKHMAAWVSANPLNTVHLFDEGLVAGGWCSLAYVVTTEGCQQTIAIGVVL